MEEFFLNFFRAEGDQDVLCSLLAIRRTQVGVIRQSVLYCSQVPLTACLWSREICIFCR